ncbi:Ca(2+)-dependent cysteine protease [Coemansia javaensis]|uniref:Ca(2+)-dependent cysteine protease n=1 Tax=Coemansia javaensis TaxID=2761396 RepID=A0A9W8HCJ5_9FUNG|nr:Ca(2+)-dependent cysteine protease [Coemansia javaensis]
MYPGNYGQGDDYYQSRQAPPPPPPQRHGTGYQGGPPPGNSGYPGNGGYPGSGGYPGGGGGYQGPPPGNGGFPGNGGPPAAFPGDGYALNHGMPGGDHGGGYGGPPRGPPHGPPHGPPPGQGGFPGGGMPFPGDMTRGHGGYGSPPPPPPPGQGGFPGGGYNGGPPPGQGGFPGGGYGGPPPPPPPPQRDGYNSGPPPNGGYNSGPPPPRRDGYNSGPPPPRRDGYNSGPPPPPPNDNYGGGGRYNDDNLYAVAPTMNMPVVHYRPEDIDFSESNFPQWHSQPTPPPLPPSAPGNGIGGQGQVMHGNIPKYNIPQEIQQEASQVALSNCRGRKRALLIGINYTGTKHMLKGCINDVHNIKKFIMEHFGFKEPDMVLLTDDQRDNPRRMPTRDNILKAMKWLVSDARMNDSFFFHYSGHGVSKYSEKSEEIDGMDEFICPVDFEKNGMIIDDVMNSIMVRPLPAGARLTAIYDCCHSATILDLPFTYNHMGKLKNETPLSYVGKGLKAAGTMYLGGDLGGAIKNVMKSLDMAVTGDQKLSKMRATKSTLGDVIMFSGCKDDQTSADTKTENLDLANTKSDLAFTGAMSHALISSMNARPHQTYVMLLQDIRRRLALKFAQAQVPQLSTGRLMDMNTIFIM